MPTPVHSRPVAIRTLGSASPRRAPTPGVGDSSLPDDTYEEIPEKRSSARRRPPSPTPDSPPAAPVSSRAARLLRHQAHDGLRAVQTQEFEAIMRQHAQSYGGHDDDDDGNDLSAKLCAYVRAVQNQGNRFLPKSLNFSAYMGFLTEADIADIVALCPRIETVTLQCTATRLPKSYTGSFTDGWLADGTLSIGDKTFKGKFVKGIPTGWIVETLHAPAHTRYECEAMWKDGRVEWADIKWAHAFDPCALAKSPAPDAYALAEYKGQVVHKFDARRGPIALGLGIAVLKTGETIEGLFVDNNCKPDQDDVRITYRTHQRGWREFRGTIKDGAPHQGVMTFKDQSVYEGAWVASEPHGEGAWERKAGGADAVVYFEGVFDVGNPAAGTATIRYADGSRFVGEVAAGKLDLRAGLTPGQRLQGEMTYPNGDRYMGSWHDNKRSGQGEMTSKPIAPGGKIPRYRGAWRANQRSGQGTMEYGSGAVYTGTWLEDQRVPSTLLGAVWNWLSGSGTETT